MKHLVVHYKNKYPDCHVDHSDDKLDVHGAEGLLVSLRRDGSGMIVDKSAENGASDKHDLSPIPKDARVHKLYESGKMGLSEESEKRKLAVKKLHVDGKILSINEYKTLGYEFNDKGEVKEWPKAKVQEIQE